MPRDKYYVTPKVRDLCHSPPPILNQILHYDYTYTSTAHARTMSTQDIAPENTAAEATDLPETRADGKAYIDDDGAPCDDDKDAEVDDGSSVEMESSDDERLNVNGGWPEDPNDFDRVAYEELDEDAQLDWGVEDEDWELADGGTFLSWPVFLCRRLLTAKL